MSWATNHVGYPVQDHSQDPAAVTTIQMQDSQDSTDGTAQGTQ